MAPTQLVLVLVLVLVLALVLGASLMGCSSSTATTDACPADFPSGGCPDDETHVCTYFRSCSVYYTCKCARGYDGWSCASSVAPAPCDAGTDSADDGG